MGPQIIQRGYRGMKSDAVIVGNPIQAAEQLRPSKIWASQMSHVDA